MSHFKKFDFTLLIFSFFIQMEESKLLCPMESLGGRNPIREHAMCYTDQKDNLTVDSMTDKHKEQGITYWTNLKFNQFLILHEIMR